MKHILIISSFIFTVYCTAQQSDFKDINFKKADSIALYYKNEALDNLPLLAYQLTENLTTDTERFRAIYMWVCSNIANDYKLYIRNKHQRRRYKNDLEKLNAWNTRFSKTLFKTLQKRKRTVCTGYAYLVRELASFADIDCKIVQGYSKTSTTEIDKLTAPNHSWNAVKLNGKWYLCDPTWASGIVNPETNRFQFQYNDGYFLTTPALFALNHFPSDKSWLLTTANTTTFKQFLAAPIVYGSAFSKLESHDSPKQLHQNVLKYEVVHFKYLVKDNISTSETYFLRYDGNYITKKLPIALKSTNGILELDYQFTKTGMYDLHLYIENKLIATYTFNVKDKMLALNY